MTHRFLLLCILMCNLTLTTFSLYIRGQEASHVLQLPFRTVKFIDKFIFFTTNNGRYFGYINVQKKGAVDVIYELDYTERIMEEFSVSNKLIIGKKNKTLLHFQPIKRILEIDNRLANQSFKELKAFKQVNDKVYVITEKAILFYRQTADLKLEFVKELLSEDMLNPGVTEFYHNLHFFPTKKFPDRVIALTTAVFEKNEDSETEKLLSCFKWFEGENQEVDGKCTVEERVDIQDFRVTGRCAYLRMPDETYVYDESLTMKTKWDQMPTQYVAGHAVTIDQLTYLHKTNELAYYRLVENFKNDDIKMTANEDNLFISKKGQTIIRLTKPPETEVIGAWILELDEVTFKILLQFDRTDLHCYKIIRKADSTEINYLFRLTPSELGFSGMNFADEKAQKDQETLSPHTTVNYGDKTDAKKRQNSTATNKEL